MGGSNALASANMILAGYDKVIPLDETIGAIYEDRSVAAAGTALYLWWSWKDKDCPGDSGSGPTRIFRGRGAVEVCRCA